MKSKVKECFLFWLFMTTICSIFFSFNFLSSRLDERTQRNPEKLMDCSNKVPQPSHLNCLLHQWMTSLLGSMGAITVSLIHPCIMDEGILSNFHIISLHPTLKLWKRGMDILGSSCNSGQNGILNPIILEIYIVIEQNYFSLLC